MKQTTKKTLALICFWISMTGTMLAQLPTGWSETDIGTVGIAGSSTFSNGAFALTGAGYGTTSTTVDRMHFVYQQLSGDVTIVARIGSLPGFSSEAGVMVRESLNTGSAFAYSAALPYGSSLYSIGAFRTTTNSSSSFTPLAVVPGPYWFKLVRSGNTFTSYISTDGVIWETSTSQSVSMAQSVYVGLVTASGTTSSTVTVTFDHVSVGSASAPAPAITGVSATTGSVNDEVLINGSGFGASQDDSLVKLNGASVTTNSWGDTGILITIPSGATSGSLAVAVAPSMNESNPVLFTVTTQPLPAGWLDRDIGLTGLLGTATYSSGTFTINGAGYGAISTANDRLHYVYQPLVGDGIIIARIASVSGGPAYQAGVMIRETLNSNAKQVFVNGSAYTSSLYFSAVSRTTTGSSSSYSGLGVYALPYWVKLIRSGNSFTSYTSSDGVTWASGGSQTVTMAQNVYIGLTSSSGTSSSSTTTTFDNVSVSGGLMPLVISLSPSSGAIGTSVTVNGASFGATQGTSTLTFNGASATSITSWANNQIVALVPSTATPGPVVVTVNSVASNSNVNFTVNHPIIDELAPPAAVAGAWVNVNGHGFGSNLSHSDTVDFNGVQAAVVSWSDTSITAIVPSTISTGPVSVTKGGVTSDGVSFTLEPGPPAVTNLSPVHGVVGTWPITISGTGFGPTQSNSTVKFWGSNSSAQIVSWSDTAISVVVPDDAVTGPVTVTVATIKAEGPWFNIESIAELTDSLSNETTYTSLMIGSQWTAEQADGPGCFGCSIRGTEQNSIDSNGNLLVHTDALGHTTSYTYDSDNNVISVAQPLDGSTTATTSYTYNDKGEVLTMTDPLGHVTTNTYDTHGNLLTVTTPAPNGSTAASVTQFAYNSMGELTSITDPLSHGTSIAYTSAGLIHTITDAQSHVTTYGYDARGNRTSVTDALSHVTSFAYDIMGRLTGITYPDSSTVSFAYDSRGRRTSVTDQLGHVTSYTYDDADRLTKVTDAASHDTLYAYDSENNLTSITDANGHTTSFSYDALGRVTQTSFPSSYAETYAYDALGNLTSKTDRKGQTISYVYDALNRMTQKSYPDSTSVEYVYDLVGKVMQVNDPTGTYGFAYDNMGRLIGTTTEYSFLTGHTFTNTYTYDAVSNRTGFTAPDGSTNSYSYDTLNRLSNLTNSLTGSFGFSYDQLSRRTQLTRPNGANTNYTYDNLSRLLSGLHQSGSTTLDGSSYTYDNAGNRVSKTNYLNNVTEGYSYDPLYQLTQVTQGASTTESYTYDAAGNRLSSLGVSPYQYNPSNELTSTPSTTYAYDYNGNTVSKTDSSGTTTYGWDLKNQLNTVVLPGTGGTVTFKYDPLGRRIQKVSPSVATTYLYDGVNIIEEIDSSGNRLTSYAQGLEMGQAFAQFHSTGTTYYNSDALGSITSMTDTAGSIVNSYSYNTFGSSTVISGASQNILRYIGRELDAETGLQYHRFRYHDPAIGRFLSEDPIGFMGGTNFYDYVSNDPVNFLDPSGLREYPNGFIGPLQTSDYYTSQMDATPCGKVPPHPPWENLDNNIDEARRHWNPYWFRDQVKNNGPWDFKQQSPLYQDYGNYSFGATGYGFGFAENVLLREAGRANQVADPKRGNMGLGDPGPRWYPFGGTPPFGDDAQDQEQIKNGVKYCKCKLGIK